MKRELLRMISNLAMVATFLVIAFKYADLETQLEAKRVELFKCQVDSR